MKIAVLASGELGFMSTLFILEKFGIKCILSDARSENIIKLARSKEIALFLGNPRKGKVSEFIKDKKIDVLLSVNYIYLIEQDLIDWPGKYAINLHGSLLPKYRGRTPHVWAIINNEKETGITAHLIDSGCDSGPIVEQVIIPIQEAYTGADLLKIYYEKYPGLIASVLEKVRKDTLEPIKQDHALATYFGKRTPDDGHIEWDWTKERIYNWVRAQARPYPGAFSYYQGKKIVIYKIRYSSLGFDYRDKNGLN
ncbi:Bifunctional polymyxin resistance protein ArnA [subsurface metagenome]